MGAERLLQILEIVFLIFAAACDVVRSDNAQVLYVSKAKGEYDFINKLDTSQQDWTDEDPWQAATGNNEVSAFTAFQWDDRTEWEKVFGWFRRPRKFAPMYLCNSDSDAEFSPPPVLSSNECSNEHFMFYVRKDNGNSLKRLYYVTCEMKEKDFTASYTRVSRNGVWCKDNHKQIERDSFYVQDIVSNCSPPEGFDNGRASESNLRGVQYARYTCNEGSKLIGQQQVTCNTETGRWSGEPPYCKDVTCSPPGEIKNGELVPESKKNGKLIKGRERYLSGQSVQYECDTGYETVNGNQLRCEDGQWSGSVACKKVTCGTIKDLADGTFVSTGIEYEDTVQFNCNDGFYLEGAAEITCTLNGQWSSSSPVCKRILCPILGHPDGGFRTETTYFIGAQTTFSCYEGYELMGEALLTCEKSTETTGKWDASPPTCEVYRCDGLTAPANGDMFGSDVTYESEASFSCHTGYQLIGEQTITCGAYGWDAPVPSCQVVTCPALKPGSHLTAEPLSKTYIYEDVVNFSCDEGYNLVGSTQISCLSTGKWSGSLSVCEAVPCPPIQAPLNGYKTDSLHVFGSEVSFLCFPGYDLEGEERTTCMANGQWNHGAPVCKPCPVGFYKETSDNSSCTQCPENTVTASEASTDILHCQCLAGFVRTSSGACEEVSCEALSAPGNGTMSECGTAYGVECRFTCDPGFFMSGSDTRRCLIGGWSGASTHCKPCPVGSYRSEAGTGRTCMPCAQHSTTLPGWPATSESDCVCEEGYEDNGVGCRDVDECLDNNGGCSQGCINTDGDYMCNCTVPGYELYNNTCYLAKTCQELTDSVDNGNLACTKNDEFNSEMCKITCNDGYFFVSGNNNYVTCGPGSDFQWSHQRGNQTNRIPGCTEEFFVDMAISLSLQYLSGESCYHVHDKAPLIDSKLLEAINNLQFCNEHCRITDFNITCSDRDDGQLVARVWVQVLVINFDEEAVSPECDASCQGLNLREMLARTYYMKSAVEKLVQTQSDDLVIDGMQVVSTSFEDERPQILCKEGKVYTKKRLCVPCDVGYYLPDRELTACQPCPIGKYQDEKGQASCKACPSGSTTLSDGAYDVSQCSVRTMTVGLSAAQSALTQGISESLSEPMTDQEMDDILSLI
jgi:CUB/sushi domain-containing protein